ncbi:peroxiredoxin [Streptomyces sp. SID3343]|uniref:redoxin domain-containing protein n=1 Tax=Streptomyces sp. SID3343 TaxID=2690260 RepID=UPI00136FA797|nr:redoxin domain-containing protein [Streptomyces sp. SID3343]
MSKSPELGAPAPDFTLQSVHLTDGKVERAPLTLSAQRGRPVVLAFYPGDDTAVCTKQLCSYSSGFERFTELDAVVWGISAQDLDSHERFARKHDLRMPLLADTAHTVIADYGIGLGSGLRRAVFVIDAQGVLRWKHVALVGLTYRGVDTITEQLRLLRT